MINLIEWFIKKAKVNRTSKIDKIPSKSINDVLKPIYILSNIFGLRVFEFPRNHSRPILSFIYSMLVLILILKCGQIHIERSRLFHTISILGYFSIISNLLVLLICLLLGLYHTESSKKCAKRIEAIDKTLHNLGSSSTFNKIYRITTRDLTIIFFYLLVFFTTILLGKIMTNQTNYTTLDICLKFIQYTYTFMVEFLMLFQYVTIVRCIKSEFQRGNELLSDVNVLPISSIASEIIDRKKTHDGSLYIEQLLPVNKNKLFICVSSSKRQMQSKLQDVNYQLNRSKLLLRTIRQIHLELYRISKCFSKMYGLQISLEIAICICFNTFVLYNLYGKYIEETPTIILIFQSVLTSVFFFQNAVRIFLINYICDKTTNEAKRTSEIIYTYYGKSMDVEIQKEVEMFSIQMLQFRNAYSAFGLYNFDCKKICSCLGVLTTYLVILIQVADSIRNES